MSERDPATTRMFREAAESASAVRRQLAANRERAAALGERLRKAAPRAVVTCARGSSDHAATYAKYLIESHTGVLTSSAAPSVSSIYDAQGDMRGVLFIAISQSGKSPDLLTTTLNIWLPAPGSDRPCDKFGQMNRWPGYAALR